MKDLLEAIELHSRGKKLSTQQIYKRVGKSYAAYCKNNQIEWHQAKYHDILGYLEHLKTNKGVKSGDKDTWCNRTVRRSLVLLAAVYRANRIDPTIFDSAFKLVPVSLKPQKRITGYVPFDQVMLLFEATSKDKVGARNRAYMALCFGGALRTSEAINLTISDLKITEKGTAYVHIADSKTNVAAQQIIMPSLVPYIEEYKKIRLGEWAATSDPFLTSYDCLGVNPLNSKLGKKRMLEVFWKLCEKVLGRKLGTHSMRATAITKLIDVGVPYRKIQDFSRHSTIAMVELYDKNLNDIDKSPVKNITFSTK
jgi:integrase